MWPYNCGNLRAARQPMHVSGWGWLVARHQGTPRSAAPPPAQEHQDESTKAAQEELRKRSSKPDESGRNPIDYQPQVRNTNSVCARNRSARSTLLSRAILFPLPETPIGLRLDITCTYAPHPTLQTQIPAAAGASLLLALRLTPQPPHRNPLALHAAGGCRHSSQRSQQPASRGRVHGGIPACVQELNGSRHQAQPRLAMRCKLLPRCTAGLQLSQYNTREGMGRSTALNTRKREGGAGAQRT